MAQEALLGWIPGPNGTQVWGPTGAYTEYVPSNAPPPPDAENVADVVAALTAATGNTGSYGGYQGLQAQAYVEQLAREYLEEARIAAAAAAAAGNVGPSVALESALASGNYGAVGDSTSVLPAFRPNTSPPVMETHTQTYYDSLRADPTLTIGRSPLQTGGYIPPGYSLDGNGQIRPGTGVGISGHIPPAPTQSALTAPRSMGPGLIVAPAIALQDWDEEDPRITQSAEDAAMRVGMAAPEGTSNVVLVALVVLGLWWWFSRKRAL